MRNGNGSLSQLDPPENSKVREIGRIDRPLRCVIIVGEE